MFRELKTIDLPSDEQLRASIRKLLLTIGGQVGLENLPLVELISKLSTSSQLVIKTYLRKPGTIREVVESLQQEFELELSVSFVRDTIKHFLSHMENLANYSLSPDEFNAPGRFEEFVERTHRSHTRLLDQHNIQTFWNDLRINLPQYSELADKLDDYYDRAVTVGAFRGKVSIDLSYTEILTLRDLLITDIDFSHINEQHIAAILSLYRFSVQALTLKGSEQRLNTPTYTLHHLIAEAYTRISTIRPDLVGLGIEAYDETSEEGVEDEESDGGIEA